MYRRQFLTITASGLAAAYTAGCSPYDSHIQAVVTILPLRYFVERIGGERVRVSVLAGPGQNPATYEPLPRQLLDLARADLLFRTGVPFEEAFVPRLSENAPEVTVVDLRQGIELMPVDTLRTIAGMEDTADDTYSASEHIDHTHSGLDPHIWLSPALVRIQAATIRDALIATDSDFEGMYRANYASFDSELAALSDEIRSITGRLETPAMLVFHPAWGYFAREFELTQIPIEIEGKEPGPRDLAAVIEYARKEHIRVVFVQAQFAGDSAEAIARAIEGTVVSIDPLSDNYIENLRGVTASIAAALGDDTP